MLAWDLTKAASELQTLRINARILDDVNSQVIRITPAQFCDTIGVSQMTLMTTPLSKQWPVPRFAAKSHLPWVDQILDVQNDESDVPNQIACITQVTLEKWSSLTAQEIRSALPSRPSFPAWPP